MTKWAYGNTPLEPRWVEYAGAEGDVLKPGYALCFNHDASTANDQEYQVEKPSWDNIYYPAGVMSDAKGEITVDSTGIARIEIIPLGAETPGVEVFTDGNIAAGDLLEMVPGSFYFKKFVGFNQPLLRANQTVDRSSTAGLVRGSYGFLQIGDEEKAQKFAGYTLAPNGAFTFSETANAALWNATLIDGGLDNGEVIGFSSQRFISTTNDADNDVNNLQMNEEIIRLASKSGLFVVRALQINDADTADWFIGLATTDATIMAGVTDRIGFEVPAGDSAQSILLAIEKNSTETSVDTGTDAADATSVTLAFYYDADQDAVRGWVNGTEFLSSGSAIAATNVPDDLDLAPTIEVRNASAAASTLSFASAFWGNALT